MTKVKTIYLHFYIFPCIIYHTDHLKWISHIVWKCKKQNNVSLACLANSCLAKAIFVLFYRAQRLEHRNGFLTYLEHLRLGLNQMSTPEVNKKTSSSQHFLYPASGLIPGRYFFKNILQKATENNSSVFYLLPVYFYHLNS